MKTYQIVSVIVVPVVRGIAEVNNTPGYASGVFCFKGGCLSLEEAFIRKAGR
jgi:hypothetical protein